MEDINMYAVLDKLQGGIVHRHEGAEGGIFLALQGTDFLPLAGASTDFKHLLKTVPDLVTSRLDKEGHRKMFEALFQATRLDIIEYKRQLKGSMKKRYYARLEKFAALIRQTVQTCQKFLKDKVIRIVCQQIITFLDTPPGQTSSNNGYYHAIALPLVKALNLILSHQPHLEHLNALDWTELVVFCCSHLRCHQLELNETTVGSFGSFSSSHNGVSNGSLLSTINHERSEFMDCLSQLASVPHAFIYRRPTSGSDDGEPEIDPAELLAETLLDFLTHQPTETTAHMSALSALNHTLCVISSNRLLYSLNAAARLVPLLSKMWHTKKPLLKEQLIIILIFCFPHIRALLKEPGTSKIKSQLEDLLEIMQSDYNSWSDKDQLQLDQISFPQLRKTVAETPHSLSFRAFELRKGFTRAESSWMSLQLISMLMLILESDTDEDPMDIDEDDAPRGKRAKRSSKINDIFYNIRHSRSGKRNASLQALPFFLHYWTGSADERDSLISDLLVLCSDENVDTSNWAMLSLITILVNQPSSYILPATHAQQCWQVAVRALTTLATSRVSCQLLGVLLMFNSVNIGDVIQAVDHIIQNVELEGPALVTDSSLLFWSEVLMQRSSLTNVSLIQPEERAIQWILSKWKPLDGFGRSQALPTQTFEPSRVLSLLLFCCGHESFIYDAYEDTSLGTVGKAALRAEDLSGVLAYLLIEEDETVQDLKTPCVWFERNQSLISQDSQSRQVLIKTQIREFLGHTLDGLLEKWLDDKNEIPVATSMDSVQTLCTVLFIAAGLHLVAKSTDDEVADSLGNQIIAFANKVSELFDKLDPNMEHVKTFTRCLLPFLPSIHTLMKASEDHTKQFALQPIPSKVLEIFDHVMLRLVSNPDVVDVDMDNDEEDEVRKKDKDDEDKDTRREATESLCSNNINTFFTLQLLHFTALSSLSKSNEDRFIDTFVTYLDALDAPQLIMSRPLLSHFFKFSSHIPDETISMIIVPIARKMLRGYDLERCELASLICIDMLRSLTQKWIDSGDNSELHRCCDALYDFVVGHAIKQQLSSCNVKKAFALLLHDVFQIDISYGTTNSRSARTNFVDLLEDEDMRVRFLMAQYLPSLFRKCGASDHPKILNEDLEVALLTMDDGQAQEEIAMRLYTLAQLVPVSFYVMDFSVRHVFSIADIGPIALPYISRVMLYISRELGFDTVQELCRQFQAPVIYSWLNPRVEERIPFKLNDIPYSVFGYTTLKQFCVEVQVELVAQLLMLDRFDEAGELADILEVEFDQLMEHSFYKAYTYINTCASTKKEGSKGDIRLKKRLGDDMYGTLLGKQLALILATFFEIMNEDGRSMETFSKDPSLSAQAHMLNQIISISSSNEKAPQPFRPFFRIRYVNASIEHLCSNKAKFGRGTGVWGIWDAAIYVFVVRKLLESITKALGSTQASFVVRKIRYIVCLAGDTATQGYPLQMTIHGLVPLLTDTHCAKDAVGLVQYLLAAGKEHMMKVPEFLVSTSLSILTGLKTFISKESTESNEQSQIQSSQATAENFQNWLATYLTDYHSPLLNQRRQFTFHAIVKSVLDIKSGKATNSTEYALLHSLIHDESNSDRLLDDASKRLAFSVLATSFSRKNLSRNHRFHEIRDTDQNAQEIADSEAIWVSQVLLRTCRKYSISKEYLLWAARILGRSFAASGVIYDEWTQEIALQEMLPPNFAGQKTSDGSHSRHSILQAIQNLLLGSKNLEVGYAETALRDIIHWGSIGHTDQSGQAAVNEFVRRTMQWGTMDPPPALENLKGLSAISSVPKLSSAPPLDVWLKSLTTWMTCSVKDSTADKIGKLIEDVPGFAEEVVPFLIHILLTEDITINGKVLRNELSIFFKECFEQCTKATIRHTSILIKCLIYLRTQAFPNEAHPVAREEWLKLDYLVLANAAVICKMYKTALLFVEIHHNRISKSETSSANIMLEIFRNISDPDSFYGVTQTPSITSVMDRYKYENDGWKSLSFQGAYLDSNIRGEDGRDIASTLGSMRGTVNALSNIGLNALSFSTLRNAQDNSQELLENLLQSAWKLEQWDLPCPQNYTSESATIYRALQSINTSSNAEHLVNHIDGPAYDVMERIISTEQSGHSLATHMRTLAMLTEIEEIVISADANELASTAANLSARGKWMDIGSFSDVERIHSARIATFSSLVKRPHLRSLSNVNLSTARLFEARALVDACQVSRSHNVLQNSLSYASYLGRLVEPCRKDRVAIEAAAMLEAANVLWDQGEMITSIGILRSLVIGRNAMEQSIPVGQAELHSKLGTWISEARLEKPDFIMKNYFEIAISGTHKTGTKSSDGKVFHEFAVFCDQQLQDQGYAEDLERANILRTQKWNEIQELGRLIKGTKDPKKAAQHRGYLQKQQLLFEHDNIEYSRLKQNRQAFLKQSIENYIKCLGACDKYDNNAVRFCALWLEHSSDEDANNAASDLSSVPSRKFVPMMNQLSSRLSGSGDHFQQLLMQLIIRICKDHPYHGLYQIMALERQTFRSKEAKDPDALARAAQATEVLKQLQKDSVSKLIARNMLKATELFMHLANEKLDREKKPDKQLKNAFPALFPHHYREFNEKIPKLAVPPPTMSISVRADCDYRKIATIHKFDPDLILASGISVPKIITCRASNGKQHKQLFKGGNDDLRQDAIMEQVFEQVSELLQKSRTTRQRNLSIRTYKVIPLSTTSGIIEFVLHTQPLHDYLLPAHSKYRPKDWKTPICRKAIGDVQNKPRDARVKAYQEVCLHFKPVMRYFFLHGSHGPDEWFAKRLAYTRSTAAISILGHVLGLGDRHGHNILLDNQSGEVVHIDLGVAFEQGRILPVPEVVPFRLTRDIVDGMGITKTEGVFRRCCEFTLTVLREESYNIMTILDVLRYDPLYSWTVSPLRLKKIQAQEESALQSDVSNEKKTDPSGSEADRALSVVLKKLSKTLSVQATVNELIQQAVDEKNLALLYAGWAAYV